MNLHCFMLLTLALAPTLMTCLVCIFPQGGYIVMVFSGQAGLGVFTFNSSLPASEILKCLPQKGLEPFWAGS